MMPENRKVPFLSLPRFLHFAGYRAKVPPFVGVLMVSRVRTSNRAFIGSTVFAAVELWEAVLLFLIFSTILLTSS